MATSRRLKGMVSWCSLTPAELLSSFMADGNTDPKLFKAGIKTLFERTGQHPYAAGTSRHAAGLRNCAPNQARTPLPSYAPTQRETREAEMEILAKAGSPVSVSPGTEMRIGYGFPKAGELLAPACPWAYRWTTRYWPATRTCLASSICLEISRMPGATTNSRCPPGAPWNWLLSHRPQGRLYPG
jgi:hypothetical protein